MELKKQNLKTGDILHCTSNKFISRLIHKFTKSRINHTALVIEVWGELFIIDSQKDGTNLRPIDMWNKKCNYEYIAHRPEEFTVERRSRAVSKIGFTPYDFMSLFWQIVYIFTGKWHGLKKEDAEKKLYCSEYVAWVFELDNWWKLSPEDLYQTVSNDERFTKIYPG